jgi:hypothetical protein
MPLQIDDILTGTMVLQECMDFRITQLKSRCFTIRQQGSRGINLAASAVLPAIRIQWNIHVMRIRKGHKTIVILITVTVKVMLSLYRPWRPLGLPEVEVPTFSDIRLTDGGKVVSPTPRPLFTTRKISSTYFC